MVWQPARRRQAKGSRHAKKGASRDQNWEPGARIKKGRMFGKEGRGKAEALILNRKKFLNRRKQRERRNNSLQPDLTVPNLLNASVV